MKRWIALLITVIFVVALVTGCGKKTGVTGNEPETTPVQSNADGSKADEPEATPAQSKADGSAANEPDEKVTYDKPKVFMTSDISPEGLMSVYEALGRPAEGKTAIKLHFGEPGNKYYLSPDLVKDLTLAVDGTFVDSNTYYGGARVQTAAHLQAAKDHGYTYAPVDILDSEGEMTLPITGGERLQEAIVGSHYEDYDFIISIAHFKGHEMAGFGGTFKNLAVGISSVNGKKAIHDEPGSWMFSTKGDAFLEKIVEVTKAILDDKGDKIVFINVMNNLSKDCDCNGRAAKPQMPDVGILASLDPVALDQACVDLVFAAPESENQQLASRIEDLNGQHLLDYAQELGLGSKEYELVNLDD
jgi:uncharacterized Fe-S center protein